MTCDYPFLPRNMTRYPIVLKDDAFPANFVQVSSYNEQALVYSGLLAGNAAFASRSACLRAEGQTPNEVSFACVHAY
jgi:hypothetical protein